ncbi:MAG TPA: hypothetical protein VLD86_10290, partial [Ilumatobacteraceae bacterium]|nr:hypothetical protein [Ilumatobacteraceae bacterium]
GAEANDKAQATTVVPLPPLAAQQTIMTSSNDEGAGLGEVEAEPIEGVGGSQPGMRRRLR